LSYYHGVLIAWMMVRQVAPSPFYRHSIISSSSSSLSSSSPTLFGVSRGGGLFGKDENAATTATTTNGVDQNKKYPAMNQDEVEEWLAHIPVFAVTDSSGNGIVLKPDDGTSVFYFFMSAQMANATLTQLKDTNADLDLRVSAFSLGKVWFKVLKSNGDEQKSVKIKEVTEADDSNSIVTNEIEYRLVPDTRDLLGARMLLTMDPADGEALKSGGELTPEMAQTAIKKAMSESPKFNSTYNEIPIFMIQQMRMQKQLSPEEDSDENNNNNNEPVLPMYFNLQNMVTLWQQFTSQSPEAKGVEPAINLMDLSEMVDKMQEDSEIDFRNIVLVPPTPMGTKAVDGTSANGEAVAPISSSNNNNNDEPFKMPGDTTLGDL